MRRGRYRWIRRFGDSRSPLGSRRPARSRTTALSAEPPIIYADSSALVKLVITEAESVALEAYVASRTPLLATSRIALVEVARAVRIANPDPEVEREAARLLNSCLLVNVTDVLLRQAARLASAQLRTLDAVHVASAAYVEPDEVLVYDNRLAEAFVTEGLSVQAPA